MKIRSTMKGFIFGWSYVGSQMKWLKLNGLHSVNGLHARQFKARDPPVSEKCYWSSMTGVRHRKSLAIQLFYLDFLSPDHQSGHHAALLLCSLQFCLLLGLFDLLCGPEEGNLHLFLQMIDLLLLLTMPQSWSQVSPAVSEPHVSYSRESPHTGLLSWPPSKPQLSHLLDLYWNSFCRTSQTQAWFRLIWFYHALTDWLSLLPSDRKSVV